MNLTGSLFVETADVYCLRVLHGGTVQLEAAPDALGSRVCALVQFKRAGQAERHGRLFVYILHGPRVCAPNEVFCAPAPDHFKPIDRRGYDVITVSPEVDSEDVVLINISPTRVWPLGS